MKSALEKLILPIILTALTLYVTNSMDNRDMNTEKIKLTFEILNSVENKDVSRMLMCQRIINEVLDGKQYQNLNGIINDYIKAELDKAVKSGDMAAVDTLNAMIQSNGGAESKSIMDKSTNGIKKKINKYREAKRLEKEAFRSIANNDRNTAISKLDSAEKMYPTYHNVAEIKTVLLNTVDMNAAKRKIVVSYQWQAPVTEINDIKAQIKQ